MNGLAALWVWQDRQGALQVLSPTGHAGLGSLPVPPNPSAHEQTQTGGIDAAHLLPKPLWDWLEAHSQQASVLLLDASLPRAWHTLAWETLTWRGQKLDTWLRVVRYAKRAGQPVDDGGESLVWDQWPGSEFAKLWGSLRGERRFKREQIEDEVRRGRDVGHFARLVIIAHGGESEGVCLLDKSGVVWPLELPATLPPEVLVLACASYHGTVHDLAVRCLERGARAVICGHGLMNAALMAGFLESWLQESPGSAAKLPYQRLWQWQECCVDERGGVRWLRYYGAVALHEYDQNTLAFFQSDLNPVTALSNAIADDRAAAMAFLTAVQNVDIWPLTAGWLLPLALFFAEKHDHAARHGLKKRLDRFAVRCPELTAERAYGMAAMYRRDGCYPLAVAQLVEGLQAKPGRQQEINLLGSLLNDLIDLNLPAAGQTLADRLDHSLACVDDDRQAFKFLDRRARLALRGGNVDAALDCWQDKRRQVDGDDSRELACLLYANAWFMRPEAEALADAVWLRLQGMAEFGSGNDNRAYLLRALAVWQWRCAGKADRLSPFLPACKAQISRQDPGPYGFILVYHRLASGDGQHWSQAVSGLTRGRYCLELAAFHALVGDQAEARGALERFQSQRQEALQPLVNAGLYGIDWLGETAQRQHLEREVLLTGQASAEALLDCGLLPL